MTSVVITVGSDHHRFDRLVRWVDDWAARHPAVDVWCQHGPADAPVHAAGVPFVAGDELLSRIARADAVVTAAGPGTVMEAQAAGLRPIVVPRRSSLEEIVDDHQLAFARRLGEAGTAVVCERAPELWSALDAVAADAAALRLDTTNPPPEPAGRRRVAELVDELVRGG